MHGPSFVADLAVVLGVAAATSVVARRLRQPTIVGYLIAGLLVGPYIPLPLFAELSRVEALAEFGVVFVMFAVGLEFRIGRLIRVLPVSGLTGLVQVSFLLFCGYALGGMLGWSPVERVFLGASIAISSTMVVSNVLTSEPVEADVREHVFGVLIIQDVVAIALIAAMTAVAAGEGLAPRALASVLVQLFTVLVGLLVMGMLVVPRAIRWVARNGSTEIMAVVAVALCFGTAALASRLGYSVALGAFIAGILVAESGRGAEVEHLIQPVKDMFAAVFFVSVGMSVDPRQAIAEFDVALAVAATVAAGQFLSVALAGVLSGIGLRRAITAGLSLGQIGEFAFIIGGIGVSASVVRPELQPILLTVAVLTAFTTPLLIASADRVVHLVDHWSPAPVARLLCLYEAWVARLRIDGPSGPIGRSLRVLVFDATALLVLLHIAVSWLGPASGWFAERLSVDPTTAGLLTYTGCLLLALPLLVGLVRNTLWFSRLATAAVIEEQAGTPAARAAEGTLKVMIRFAIALGVGVPLVAVLQPLTGPVNGGLLLSGFVVVVALYVVRRAGKVEPEFQSGAAEIARALSAQDDHTAGESLDNPDLLPGLDTVTRLVVESESHAVSHTLAELDLRARTGATVVAIQRGTANVILPTGHERLLPGDVLALTGTADSIQLADRLLQAGATSDLLVSLEPAVRTD
jgi:CPA2 family monovalent cation:H+ antiporter-2